MDRLLADNENVTSLFLRPYRVSEGEPEWFYVELHLQHRGDFLLRTSVTLTADDLSTLTEATRSCSSEPRKELRFTSTDEDFALEIGPAPTPGDGVLTFMVGDLYDLRRGFQFVVTSESLSDFGPSLESEIRVLQVSSNSA